MKTPSEDPSIPSVCLHRFQCLALALRRPDGISVETVHSAGNCHNETRGDPAGDPPAGCSLDAPELLDSLADETVSLFLPADSRATRIVSPSLDHLVARGSRKRVAKGSAHGSEQT